MATPKVQDFASDLIDVASLPKSKRGRKATIIPELRDRIGVVSDGKAMPLSAVFGTTTDKNEQSKIGQKIRTHWRMVHGEDSKCSITWNEGAPFVKAKV